jgi:hypothetical protein
MKVLPKFPGTVSAGAGIVIVNAGGIYTISIDLDTIVSDVTASLVTPLPARTSATYTTTPQTISSSVVDAFFNVASASVATLPDAATWKGLNGDVEMLLKDISGAASTNNVTISRAGSNTIDGLTTFAITVDYGSWRLRVTPSNNWTFVG